MKKLVLFLFAFILFNPFTETAYAGSTNVKKSGNLQYHNYVALNTWTFDSLKVGSSDTVRFFHDTAGSRPFTTATLGKIRTVQDGVYDRMPDSVQHLITWAGETDTVKIEFVYRVGLLGASSTFHLVGTPDTLTATGATKATATTSITAARKFYPNAHHYPQIKTTTSTDTARIYKVQAIPIYR